MTEKDTYLSSDKAVIMKKILQFQPTVFFFWFGAFDEKSTTCRPFALLFMLPHQYKQSAHL